MQNDKERICELAIAAILLALIFTPVIAARGVELSVNSPEEKGEGRSERKFSGR